MRTALTRLFYKLIMQHTWKHAKHALVDYKDDKVTVRDAYMVPIRIYEPKETKETKETKEKLPAIIFYHGGGFVIGSIKTYHNLMLALCELNQCAVISMDYRLAPENPYPIPMQDVFDVTQWIMANHERLGLKDEYILAGDSAGGNLAAVMTHSLKHTHANKIKGQLLICPTTDHHEPAKASFIENGKTGPLTASMMKWFAKNYTKNGFNEQDTNLFPSRNSDFSNLPPALVFTAELDVLRDDGVEYVEKLLQAGVETVHHHQKNEVHNFPIGPIRTDNSQAMLEIKDWVKQQFTTD